MSLKTESGIFYLLHAVFCFCFQSLQCQYHWCLEGMFKKITLLLLTYCVTWRFIVSPSSFFLLTLRFVSSHVKESRTVLDSGFHAVDSGFQGLDSSLCRQNLDSAFQLLVGFWIPKAVFRIPKSKSPPGFWIPQAKSSRIPESGTVLDSGFHAVDSGFQVLDSSISQQNLDSGFQSLVGFRIS